MTCVVVLGHKRWERAQVVRTATVAWCSVWRSLLAGSGVSSWVRPGDTSSALGICSTQCLPASNLLILLHSQLSKPASYRDRDIP